MNPRCPECRYPMRLARRGAVHASAVGLITMADRYTCDVCTPEYRMPCCQRPADPKKTSVSR